MPPPQPRFPLGAPSNLGPYHHTQFAHSQNSVSHASPMGNQPSYVTQNSLNPNGNMLSLAGGFNPAAGFGSDSGLASHAARMGFAHAVPQPQHGQHQGHNMLGDHASRIQNKGRIREVWKHNLHEEMANLRDLVDKYPYIAMDTEFPGVVARPMGGFRGKSDYHYQCLRTNVDLLKVIQIGITLFNEDGETPPARPNSADSMDLVMGGRRNGHQAPAPYCWQFNFKFSLETDMFNQTSIDSLTAAGINFELLERDGIDPHEFASLLIPSGLVCFDNVKWISFHGGYDFGYLTKLLICTHLPCDEVEFDKIMKLYFPATYDVKHLMKYAIKLMNTGQLTPIAPDAQEVLQKFEQKAGLENIAETLKIKRIGAAHQAGSDSLLTGKVFFTLREKIYNGEISEDHVGKVWGLGVPDHFVPGAMATSGNQHGGQSGPVDTTPPGPGQNGSSLGVNGAPNTPSSTTGTIAHTPGPTAHNTNGGGGPTTPGGLGGFGAFNFAPAVSR